MAVAPLTEISPTKAPVMAALRHASAQTGTDFTYLLQTAMRESSLNPTVKAKTSSATGLFQFIEQTWLATVKQSGARHGLAQEAAQIERTATGRFTVPDETARAEILALREDPTIAALMAGELSAKNGASLEAALGRAASAGELYIAHFLGPRAGAALIGAAGETPDIPADSLFPQAAAANKPIFYHASGAPRSVAEVYDNLIAKHGAEGAAPPLDGPRVADAAGLQALPAHASQPGGQQNRGSGPAALAPSLTTRLSPAMLDILWRLDPLAVDQDWSGRAKA